MRNRHHQEQTTPPSVALLHGVSVIVCTRNRGESVLHTVRSVLDSVYPDFELLIVDQSDDTSTQDALRPMVEADSRLRYVRMELPGKPRALNLAASLAHGRYLALTDDDCEAWPGWIEAIVTAFESDARIGCVFGDVSAPEYDQEKGIIPTNPIESAKTIYRVSEFLRPGTDRLLDFGIGASMGARADVVSTLGGWDPCLGPGAIYGPADDHDFAVRTLAAGYAIHFAPGAKTIHYGFRDWQELKRDLIRTGVGYGAAFVKYLRCGIFYNGSARLFWFFIYEEILMKLVRLKMPHRLAWPSGWISGFFSGLRHPIDKKTRCFRDVSLQVCEQHRNNFAQIAKRSDVTDRVLK